MPTEYWDWLTSELAPRLEPLTICAPPCWRSAVRLASAFGRSCPFADLTAASAVLRLLIMDRWPGLFFTARFNASASERVAGALDWGEVLTCAVASVGTKANMRSKRFCIVWVRVGSVAVRQTLRVGFRAFFIRQLRERERFCR